ncbi:MAG: aminopeptidase P N-terminal domain-containing protein [Hymenobacteraceae bacterium]|nr:aminopeptidase P N-terminal domain-containing protein [Hymenobacteraceae bacterium]MDX5397546.1 aminopeptidase P N-terminal domain-containing protein [Hymenobacteraceae bacterium]MDX5444073.1 aminopeptidase P N-terminal domain-containing protein [Hymenobacteraceae bacterium]MDX5513624.1 aminopeptidase P N-terminal domain-containing protein [Hymenobacteraceae bacterium]
MRYLPISPDLFVHNRKNFVSEMKPCSIAVFHSNDVMPTNADGTMPFRQNNDLFYLSGIDQEESILLLFPDARDPKLQEILFLRETNEHILTWEGYKLTKDQAREKSGIRTVLWLDQFDQVFNALMTEAENIYLNTNEHLRAVIEVETRDARFIKQCKEKYPLHHYRRSAPILQNLRAIKSDMEIALIRKACNITEKAFLRLLKFIKPGVMEYEIEAEIYHEFLRNRSRGPAYGSIIASGANACILHYVDNNRECKAGDVLLLDFGAEYANYASDLSRSVPVSGKFTKRQKEVYNAVLTVMRGAMQMLVPGNTLDQYHAFVGRLMENELIKLGLLNENDVKNQDPEAPLYKKYFMHGTSHFLGLDVHDVGSKYRPFEPGMVFTCEPGIYIREEGLGIRLENDILITKNGPEDLMGDIPLEAADIERIMKEK